MANEDVSKTSGRWAIGATLAAVGALVVGTSTSIYATQRIETLQALSGAQVTVNATGTGKLIIQNRSNGVGTGGTICMKNTAGTLERVTIVGTTLTVGAANATDCVE